VPELAFATQAYGARYKGLPALTLENMYVEDSPKEALDEVHLVQAPGKTQLASLAGTGRGLWRIKGGPTSDLIAVHGQTVSRLSAAWTSTAIGSVLPQNAPVRIVSSPTHVVICDDPNLYVYTGSGSVTQVSDADLGPVTDATYSPAGYWACIRDGELKISAFEDPTDWDSLDYVGVGKWPDDNVGIAESDSDLIVFGEESAQVFSPSGDGDAPFYTLPGSRVDLGCGSTHSITFAAGTWFWLGREREASDYGIYAWPGRKVSTYAIDEAIRLLSEANRVLVKGSAYAQGGHSFVQFDLPGQGSFVYDIGMKRWHRRRQFQQTLERVMAYEAVGGRIVGLDRAGGLYGLDPNAFTDGADPLRWAFSANAPLADGRTPCWSFKVAGTMGEAIDANINPHVFMRYSNDGAGWSSLRNASLGTIGQRKARAIWRTLGEMSPPGRVFEVSSDAAVRFTPTGCVVNGDY
jgi:hypothetical protein